MSGHSCEVKQRRARLVAGWVTQALEQGRLGSCAHAGYHQYYNLVSEVGSFRIFGLNQIVQDFGFNLSDLVGSD